MDEIVAGCVQLKIRLPQDRAELEQHLLRFSRLAQTKRVRLLVFPQFSGLMTAALLTRGARTGLLKRADRARRTSASFWTRTQAKLAGSAASALGANFGKALEAALLEQSDELWDGYCSLFSSVARYHGMVVVAGSTYLVDTDGAVRHIALVFGPSGELLGQQPAVTLLANEHPMVQAGQQWHAIQTPLGRLGILIGNDMLYPEAGRLLAYAGADMLVGLGASTKPAHYQRQRYGLLARVEENQLYGVMSFAVGYNPFTPGEDLPYLGRSLLAAPISMTPRLNGVQVEMGADSTEGLITAEWNFLALRELWQADEAPLRTAMPIAATGRTLAALYDRELTIAEATRLAGPKQAALALAEPAAAVAPPESQVAGHDAQTGDDSPAETSEGVDPLSADQDPGRSGGLEHE